MRITRWLMCVLILGGAVATLGTAGRSEALPSHGWRTNYYANSDNTGLVGWEMLRCTGGYSRSGQTSPYSVTVDFDCD